MILQELANRLAIAECLLGLGRVASDPEHTARLPGAAEALREAHGAELHPLERMESEPALAVARATLGEARFALAWAAGRGMSFDDAISEALRAAGH